MADEQRDTAVIYTGRAASGPAPSIVSHAVALPPVVTGPAPVPANSPLPLAPNSGFTPIVTRGSLGGGAESTPLPNGMTPEIAIAGLPRGEAYLPGHTPLPSILRQPQPSQSVDPTLPRLRSLPVKEFLIGKSHLFVIGQSFVASIMYIASWAAAVAYEENGTLKRRHVASILGMGFQVATTLCVVAVMRMEPKLINFYFLQVMSLLTLFLTTIGMGMNNVVVDLCSANHHVEGVLCPAHIAEFFASFFVSIGMVLVFFASQQRIAVLIDKGILSNIRGRMTQL